MISYIDSLTMCLKNIFILTLSFSMFILCFSHLFLFLKKSKRSAVENSEEHSAKYNNSNNSGNWLQIVVEPSTQRSGPGVYIWSRGLGFCWPENGNECRKPKNSVPSEGLRQYSLAHRIQVLEGSSQVIEQLSLLTDGKTQSTENEHYPWKKNQHNSKCKASCFLMEPAQTEVPLNLVLCCSHHVVGECALLC